MVGGALIASPRRYQILVHPQAARAYRPLHEPLRGRISQAIERLAEEPRPHGAVQLAGLDDYRIRVGDHRIVYSVDDARLEVIVARIAHRRDVYRS